VSTGDILLHERLWKQASKDGAHGAWDFAPQFSDVAGVIRGADLALCHLETPLAKNGGPYSGYPLFNAPPQIVSAIKSTGFDMCGTASNHSFDAGSAGIARTIKALDAAGIAHTGSYQSKSASQVPLVMTVATETGTAKVGIISFTYGFNGLPYPDGHTWAANKISVRKIVAAAKACRAAGADVVIAKLHWGTEYATSPNAQQRSIARRLAASGVIDLIDGDHTHSVQPIEKIGGMWVMYSHGNFDAAQREPLTIKSEGVITRWTFSKNSAGRYEISDVAFVPTLITDAFPVRVINVPKALATHHWAPSSKSRLEKALQRTSATINSMGANATVFSSE
jgi:poly-gamma-glutamate synthesis protein (capsule biosynthesis protein)